MTSAQHAHRWQRAAASAALLAALGAHAAPPAPAAPTADDTPARVLAALRTAHPATTFTAVRATPIEGLYQVNMGPNVAYVGAHDTRHVVFGRLYDTREGRDLSGAQDGGAGARTGAVPASVDLAALPLSDSLTRVEGAGKRHLVVFSDPQCGYCRQLELHLARLRNVTIHTFIVPFQGMAGPLAVWCAPDRAAAWRAAMDGPGPAPSAGDCPNPFERNVALATRLGVRGTPTLFFANGARIDGGTDLAVIEAALHAAHPSERP